MRKDRRMIERNAVSVVRDADATTPTVGLHGVPSRSRMLRWKAEFVSLSDEAHERFLAVLGEVLSYGNCGQVLMHYGTRQRGHFGKHLTVAPAPTQTLSIFPRSTVHART
jgi:hypothetical protein